ncbi:hypothetical protein CEP53_001641 [Fusarium sp. AF-6]|nr:hypothetical protein CEP53_001641 [Fusarium sp. AF-6]
MEEAAAHNVADVCIGAQCPSYQETKEMIVAPFLQRGSLVYFWVRSNKDLRREAARPNDPQLKGHFVSDLTMGVFLAYFPTWLKFHELFRLGAYIHPFDFISNAYSNDLKASDQYLVHGDTWEAKFRALKDFEDPFALLTPAMQEGSALGGPFLPLECTLSELHHRMGLGSIWTIGLPLMPASINQNGKKSHYRLYTFPKHWQTELGVKSGLALPRTSFSNMASVTAPIIENAISLAGSALQDAMPRDANDSRLQNLSPTQPLTSTRSRVRFGSPINLIEVGSTDVVRWIPVDIKPDSLQARVVPGVPVVVHGPPVSAQPSQILPTALKRRATDDLYHPGTPKKMKTAAETHLNLEGLDANDAGRLMGYAHKQILSVAAMAGLLNPTHFEIGPRGTIRLTESGLMAVAGPEDTTADPETLRNLKRRRCALMATEVRYFMDQGGFWENGNGYLAPLKIILDEKNEVSPGDLLKYILVMYTHVAASLSYLLDTAQTLQSQRHEPMEEETKIAIARILKVLYSPHKGKGLSPATRSKVANTQPGRPRLEMAQYLVGIAKNYLDMFVFSDTALKHTKPLSVKHSKQLARSLAQQKQLSVDIQRLLDAHDDES